MKIALDARWIFPEISGVGTVTRELIRHLAQHDASHEYLLLFDDPTLRDRVCEQTQALDNPRFRPVLAPGGVYSLRNQWKTPALLRELGADIYHSTNVMIPLRAFPRGGGGAIRCVVTIHDVIPLKLPHFAPRSRKSRALPLFRGLLREIGRRADAIVTGSETSRNDVIEHLGIPASRMSRVHTVPCGIDERFRPAPQPERETKSILFVGRADPYKNLEGLLRAFARAEELGMPETKLRIVGPPDPRYPEPEALAERLGIRQRVEWTGYLDDAALVGVYQEADVLVLPSRYEGFGLPVLEAMACGTPVICSPGGALREVAGDAALLCDPDDIQGLARAIQQVLTEPEIAAALRLRGKERAAQFSWAQACTRLLAVYESLACEKNPAT